MDIGGIIALVLLGIVGLFVLISALIGLIRGLKKTLASTIVIILSIIVSFLLTFLVFKPIIMNSGVLVGAIAGLLEGSDFATILEMPAVEEALGYYVYMITAPFAFLVIFLLVSLIIGIIVTIVTKFIPIMNKIPPVAKRLGGLGVGIVNGLIVCTVILMPLLGTVKVADTVIASVAEMEEKLEESAEESAEAGSVTLLSTEQESAMGVISDYTSSVVNCPAAQIIFSCGGDLMYNSLTSVKYYDEKITLSGEIAAIEGIIDEIASADADQIIIVSVVDAIVEGVEASPVIRSFAAELVSTAAKTWQDGEAFIGIEIQPMDATIDPMMNVIFEILATEDREYILKDLKSLSAFVHKVDEKGLFDIDSESDDALDYFGQEGMISELLGTIENNDRMIPLIDEVNCVAIRIFVSSFGVFSDKQALYDDLMQSMGGTINQYNSNMINRQEAEDALADALHSHGISINKEETDNLIDALLDEYQKYYEEMPERLGEFFAVYFGTKSGTLISHSNGSLTLGEKKLEHYFAENYRYSEAYILATNGKSIGKAESLFSAETMDSVIITADILYRDLVSYKDVEDRRAESEMIDAVMVSLVDAYMNLDLETATVAEVMAEMGVVLDGMHATNVYGVAIQDFLTAIMQSDKISSSIGLNAVEMTDFANSINSGVTEQTKYSNIATTVSQSVELLDKVNSGEASKEVVQDLMKDITPDSAKVMQNITTPSLMQSYGVSEDKAEQSSSAISSLFGNMADYTTDHPQGDMSDEEYKESVQKESEAVEKILTISIKATEDKDEAESLFTTGESEGALDMSAYEVVDLFVTSDVVGDTLNDMVKGENEGETKHDPLGIENQITEQDKIEITDALNQYKADNGHVEGIDEEIQNIASLFGIVL